VLSLQKKTDRGQTDWTNVGTAMTATNGVMRIVDPAEAAAARFYRVVLLP